MQGNHPASPGLRFHKWIHLVNCTPTPKPLCLSATDGLLTPGCTDTEHAQDPQLWIHGTGTVHFTGDYYDFQKLILGYQHLAIFAHGC